MMPGAAEPALRLAMAAVDLLLLIQVSAIAVWIKRSRALFTLKPTSTTSI